MSTPTLGVLLDVETRERFDFQFNPETITDDHGTKWADHEIPGMSDPRSQWVNGGARVIAFALTFHQMDSDEFYVQRACDWLRSLTYPEYSLGKVKRGPHRVLLCIGSRFMGVECTVRKAVVRTGGLVHPDSQLPRNATVDIELREFVRDGVDYRDVRAGLR